MKRILCILCVIALSLMMAESVLAWSLPLDIDVVKIHFNHNAGSTSSDGITIQEDETTVTAPEWRPDISKNEECAYLKSVTTPTVKAEFASFDFASQGYSSITVYADATSGWELSETNAYFASEGSGLVSFNTNASYPQASTVGKWTVTWTWKVVKIDGGSVTPFSIGTSTHTFYNVLSTPTAPMAVPWVEVLDYACDWAQGETTAVNTASEVAKGIYTMGDQDGDIDYPDDGEADYSEGGFVTHFDLNKYFSHLSDSTSVKVNCSDVSNIFCIFSNVLGDSAQSRRAESGLGITTKNVDPIGSPGTTYADWDNHQFGYTNSKVYDPCIQLDSSGWYVPCNLTQSAYDTALINSGSYNIVWTVTTTLK